MIMHYRLQIDKRAVTIEAHGMSASPVEQISLQINWTTGGKEGGIGRTKRGRIYHEMLIHNKLVRTFMLKESNRTLAINPAHLPVEQRNVQTASEYKQTLNECFKR